MKRLIGTTALAGVAAIALACGGDTTIAPRTDLSSATGAQRSGDSSATPTSSGPVASLVVGPKVMLLQKGWVASVYFVARDAAGVYIGGKQATWRSTATAIADVSASGSVTAKANGSAWVIATVDGKSDSANVIVGDAPNDTVSVSVNPVGVSAFTLTLNVVGVLPGGDSTHTEPVGGVTVKLTRTTDAQGHTISPAVDAGTVTTDANGHATASNLTGGAYTMTSVSASGSPYRSTSISIAPPQSSDAHVYMLLFRAP